MPDESTKKRAPPDATPPVLSYRQDFPASRSEPLSSGRRWLLVLFFVPPLLLVVLLVLWTLGRQ